MKATFEHQLELQLITIAPGVNLARLWDKVERESSYILDSLECLYGVGIDPKLIRFGINKYKKTLTFYFTENTFSATNLPTDIDGVLRFTDSGRLIAIATIGKVTPFSDHNSANSFIEDTILLDGQFSSSSFNSTPLTSRSNQFSSGMYMIIKKAVNDAQQHFALGTLQKTCEPSDDTKETIYSIALSYEADLPLTDADKLHLIECKLESLFPEFV